MPSSLLTNIAAEVTQSSINESLNSLSKLSARLSSGQRIISASDDAAGLSIGTGLSTDKSTLDAASSTAQQAISTLNIADGGLAEVSKILARLKALASQANSGALGATELGYIKKEMDALVAQVDSVVDNTKFNGTKLLDGNYTDKEFQIGFLATDTIAVTLTSGATTDLAIDSIDVTTDVEAANTSLDTAISTVKGMRADVGALQSRFGFAASNIDSSLTNITAATSQYLDADIAGVSTEFAAEQARLQAAVSVLAQANNLPANLLKLLG